MRIGVVLGLDDKGKYSVLALPDELDPKEQKTLLKQIQRAGGKYKDKQYVRAYAFVSSGVTKRVRFDAQMPGKIKEAEDQKNKRLGDHLAAFQVEKGLKARTAFDVALGLSVSTPDVEKFLAEKGAPKPNKSGEYDVAKVRAFMLKKLGVKDEANGSDVKELKKVLTGLSKVKIDKELTAPTVVDLAKALDVDVDRVEDALLLDGAPEPEAGVYRVAAVLDFMIKALSEELKD